MPTFSPADILLPKRGTKLSHYSVIACDQYTSDKDYWKRVRDRVRKDPSTLSMIYPECYLDSPRKEHRIKSIHNSMRAFLSGDFFDTYNDAFVFVKRTFASGLVRRGLVGKVDLEDYSYESNSLTPVRATEGTVVDRIPPRAAVRREAPLELPHIMLLIDDRKKCVIEPLEERCTAKLYDFDLMCNGGHIEGYLVPDNNAVMRAINSLDNDFRFAVGDGNHSLATAKACWEEKKKTLTDEERKNHPSRYALCELVNLCDDSMQFEPIHRVMFACDINHMLAYFKSTLSNEGENLNTFTIPVCHALGKEAVTFKGPGELAVGALQALLDEYMRMFSGKLDYIHGEHTARRLGHEPGNLAFLLPAIPKTSLFDAIRADGALPRKTFSIGEADEKRFYLEARQIERL